MSLRKFLLVVLLLFPFLALGGEMGNIPSKLTFEVYVSDKPTVMFQMFRPILDAAQEFISKELGQPIQIELLISADYEGTIEDLIRGKVDMARVGPASYVTIKEKEPGTSILAMELVGGKKEFDGYVITRKNSTIQTLADLKGKSFAFGDSFSTIGRYLPQALLVQAGIRSKDLKKMEYVDRHDKVATGVLNGDFDAGAIKEETFAKFESQGEGLRKVHTLKNVTKPWLAKKGLSSDLVAGMKKFLLQLKDPTMLKNLDNSSGFTLGSDADFEPIRRSMKISQGF